jgi:hypothetical protein
VLAASVIALMLMAASTSKISVNFPPENTAQQPKKQPTLYSPPGETDVF